MPLTNTKAQIIISKQMEAINRDSTIKPAEKAKLLSMLNNSMIRNSHVQLRAMRLTSTVTRRKQQTLRAPETLLKMPVLKI